MLQADNLIPLTGGAYQARSKISNYEICENLFPEINPQDTDPIAPVTHYPREGKRLLSACPTPAFGRGVFTASNGQVFAAVGQNFYSISPDWTWTFIGQISAQATPISFVDNGRIGALVDGNIGNGWEITLSTGAFSQIQDATQTFTGGTRVDYSDTYFAFNQIGTNGWIVTSPNQIAFNTLYAANKSAKADPISTFVFLARQAWLIGQQTTEVWFNAGGTPFPYQAWPNVLIPYGIAAPYSLVKADVGLFWISRSDKGQALAVQTKGYAVEAISTRALEYEWSNYQTVADVIGGTYQVSGHTFIIFHFPSADKTWAYDLATKQWHRRTYTDKNGVAHREKTAFYTLASEQGGYLPTIIGQDWQTGAIYALDAKTYTDAGAPIICKRTFPHIAKGMLNLTHVAFVADFETGGIQNVPQPMPTGDDFNRDFNSDFGGVDQIMDPLSGPVLNLRYSNDGGSSWSNYRPKGILATGKYRQILRWRGLGMARDRIYELSWSFNGPSALQGAYIDPLVHGS